MADVEEPQFNTLAERIAALKKQQQNFQNGVPAAPDGPRKRPPPPPPPGRPTRTQTAPVPVAPTDVSRHQTPPQIPRGQNSANPSGPPPLPRRDTNATTHSGPAAQDTGRPAPPPLPSRSATSSSGASQPSPALPPRRTLTQPANALSVRRNSGSSEASTRSNLSSLSLAKTTSSSTSLGSGSTAQRKLPPPCDLASLPPLPPTKRELEARAREAAAHETAAGHAAQRPEAPASTQPQTPPSLPSRLVRSQTEVASTTAAQPATVTLRPNRVLGFNHRPANGNGVPRVPARPRFAEDDAPPPVPVTSRPSAAQIEAISSRPPPAPAAQSDCWTCRDWSGPDGVAARFPRESLPRNDPIGYLARGLCDPFPSYTDKARAIFTWFHHNIMYDTVAFFANNVGPQTPERTIQTGVAVCAGYAETYKAIAVRAGLECVVVGGHGKGFGHTALRKGERPPPPKPDGHAWNAVRVDGGDWKLVDACWGAGHICTAANLFKREFHPTQFAAPNDVFARTHFPADPGHQFRDDGRVVSWEEYYVGPCDGPPVEVYGETEHEGIAEESIEPRERHIGADGGRMVRFRFSKVCEHWTSEGSGLGPAALLLLLIQRADGSVGDMLPMESDGFWHWLDVDGRELGAAGDCVLVAKLISFGEREGKAARGVSKQEFVAKRGRVGMAWSTLMKWEVQ